MDFTAVLAGISFADVLLGIGGLVTSLGAFYASVKGGKMFLAFIRA